MGRLSPAFLFLLLLSYLMFPQNAYSALELSAFDQQIRPLPNVSFSLSCNYEEPIYGPAPKNTAICTTDKTGTCKSQSPAFQPFPF